METHRKTQPTSQKWKTHQRNTDDFTNSHGHGHVTTRQSYPGDFFLQEWRLSVSMVPCRDLELTVIFVVFFVCVLKPSFPPVQGGVTLVCFFFQGVSQARSLWMFFVESLRHWRNYTPLSWLGSFFLVVKTRVSFFSLQQIFLQKKNAILKWKVRAIDTCWNNIFLSLESRPMNMLCLGVCVKKRFTFTDFLKPIQKLAFAKKNMALNKHPEIFRLCFCCH